MADTDTDIANQQQWLPENPSFSEESHEGPRGYAHALKDGDLFVVLGARGDINAGGGGEQGLYLGGTRHLSQLMLEVNAARPTLLHAATHSENIGYVLHLTAGRGNSPISLERACCVRQRSYHERLQLTSYAREPVTVEVRYQLAADFRDMFEIRGIRRARRGQSEQAITADGEWVAHYTGLDRISRESWAQWSPAPSQFADHTAVFSLTLQPRAPRTVELRVHCGKPDKTQNYCAARDELTTDRHETRSQCAEVTTSNELYNRWLNQSAADLWMLNTLTRHGPYPYAGLPWFSTLFGRDGVITALQTLWWHPQIARAVLGELAELQASESEAERDAQPGKIIHELRQGEMANLNEIPFARYYGSADVTPLFVMLAGAYFQASADRDFIEHLWPHVVAALEWMAQHGDLDGDHLLEYQPSPRGLLQQGWKDSPDSVLTDTGELPAGPIALCEVQAYAYGAWNAGALLAEVMGEEGVSQRCRQQARALQTAFEQAFWRPEAGCYSLAVDGNKTPCPGVASNAGHTLWTGIAAPDRARRLSDTLMATPMFSGWGVRTLSTDALAFNPASYHNGSVWPHDNAIIAAGMARYGMTERAALLLRSMKEASERLDLSRLPELFCGFERQPELGPAPYPSACAPQAWSSGAAFMLLSAALGLEIDGVGRRVVFRHPTLPPDLDEVCFRQLHVGRARLDVTLYRHGQQVAVATTGGDRRQVQVVVVP